VLTHAAVDESERLYALRRLEILDTPPERRFDDIVQIAAQICDTPIAIMNLVDADRQWGKALVGVESSEAPREASFCSRTIASGDDVMVVHDTYEDPRFSDNPMVLGDPHLRFYAGAPITDRNGYRVGSVCVCDRVPRTLDEDQLAALQALARQAMGQLELRLTLDAERERVRRVHELDRIREQFISTVTHELRTPVTSIRGWLDVLAEDAEELTGGQREAIERIDRNVGRLDRLVGDLLDLTRSDVGSFSIRPEHVDLAELTREAVASMARGREASELDVRSSVPASLVVVGDAQRLAQMIDNLCSNAAKYTPAGGRIEVDLSRRGDHAVLRIADSGIGIPATERDYLFQRFFRASTAIDSQIAGTGLGLAIAKAIAERHGGSIAVGDGIDGGTAFTVALPVSAI
jgi:signal transduction histidine kinase